MHPEHLTQYGCMCQVENYKKSVRVKINKQGDSQIQLEL